MRFGLASSQSASRSESDGGGATYSFDARPELRSRGRGGGDGVVTLLLCVVSSECRTRLERVRDIIVISVSEDPHYHVSTDRLG